jgi:hypothetical protein
MSDQPPENTPPPFGTQPSSPLPSQSTSSRWEAIIGRIGAYILIGPLAWRLPELLQVEGNAGLWASLLILAVGTPTALKDVGTLLGAWRGGK